MKKIIKVVTLMEKKIKNHSTLAASYTMSLTIWAYWSLKYHSTLVALAVSLTI